MPASQPCSLPIAASIFSAMVSALVAAIWSLSDRRTVSYTRVFAWLHAGVRFLLGARLLAYGVSKILPGQFGLGVQLGVLLRPVGALKPQELLWAFMGAWNHLRARLSGHKQLLDRTPTALTIYASSFRRRSLSRPRRILKSSVCRAPRSRRGPKHQSECKPFLVVRRLAQVFHTSPTDGFYFVDIQLATRPAGTGPSEVVRRQSCDESLGSPIN